MKIFVLLGAPGSGKGTVSTKLEEVNSAVRHVSTGDLLRAATKDPQTPAARAAAEAMKAGNLVADETVAELLLDALKACPADSILLLDGYPRNEAQAETLSKLLETAGLAVTQTVLIDVPEPVLIERLSGRRVCPACGASFHVVNMKPKVDGVCDRCGGALVQRPDDNAESVKNRLQVYAKQTLPLIDYYTSRNLLTKVAGDQGSDAVAQAVTKLI